MIRNFDYDESLILDITARFALRKPVAEAFEHTVETLGAGEYMPTEPVVLDLATGVGKTYIMAALVEYLRALGKQNLVIITPSAIVQTKTVANFTPGSPKFIPGTSDQLNVITPSLYDLWQPDPLGMQVFILNVHQLVKPDKTEGETKGSTQSAAQRAAWKPNERNGVLVEYLRSLDDLVVIADEQHLYSVSARAFQAGIQALDPAAIVGLTASADKDDHVVYRYTLKQAVDDKYVKRPVIAFRRGGYGDNEEEQQLRDALTVLRVKQKHYENYWAVDPGVPRVNAVLFVQCTDIAHATEIATLLRGPEYFGNSKAVLQIDNKHDDLVTLNQLQTMDSPSSDIRAVVSVNKLKEGWDVKNVAVMVTLRAMTSEILTQQTLGRGLRLPFGKWTGVRHIDQLDIIAHDSFRRLLKEQRVLSSFGIDQVQDERLTPIPPPTHEIDSGTSGPRDIAPSSSATVAEIVSPSGAEGTSHVYVNEETGTGVVVLDDDADFDEDAVDKEPVVVRVNERFEGTSFTFPATTLKREQAPFRLTSISDKDFEEAARKITDTGDVLEREAIVVGGRELTTDSQEEVTVDALPESPLEVKKALALAILSLSSVEATDENKSYVRQVIVEIIMRSSGISDWTVKAAQSAVYQVRQVVETRAAQHARELPATPVIAPVVLPIGTEFTLPLDKAILPKLPTTSKGDSFKPHEYYGAWDKGLFEAASFDSFSTEYRIAAILNKSNRIQWWKRLYRSDNAHIAYTVTNFYYPDFVARDNAGTYWVIEGKAQSGADDETVHKKRLAAEEVIRMLRTHPAFVGQNWGYIIAFESDVAKADSWDDIVATTSPMTSKTYS
ncbi:MAG: DEAD/DEAH box helicase [Leucobacter sp.]